MFNKIIFLFVILFLFSFLPFYTQKTFAEITTSNNYINNYELEPIIIQVERLKSSSQDISGSFTLIDSNKISMTSPQSSLSSLLSSTSSLQSASSAGNQTSLFLRGVDGGRILILYDGVEIADVSGINRSAYINNIRIADIEQVEILPGNQSTLYGSDAIGGVINIISKKEKAKDANKNFPHNLGLGSGLGLGYGRNNSLWTRANVNGSYSNSRIGTTNSSLSFERNSNETQKYGHEDLSLSTNINYQSPNEKNQGEFSAKFFSDRSDLPKHGGIAGDDPNYQGKQKEYLVQLRLKTNLNQLFPYPYRFSPSLTLSQNQSKREYRNLPDADDKTDYSGNFIGKLSKINQQNTLYLNDDHFLILGFEFKREDATFDEITNNISNNFQDKIDNKQATTTSTYLWNKYHPTNNLLWLDGGLRADYHQFFGSALTYKIKGQYLLWKNENTQLNLHSAHGTGFKSPTLYQLFSTYGNMQLQPEKSDDYEIGMGVDFANKKHQSKINLFRNDLRQLIEYEYAANKFINRGKARIWGTEFIWQSQFSSITTVNLNYTYLRALDLESDQKLLRRATHKITTAINLLLSDALIYLTEINFVGARDDVDANNFNRIELPSYYTLNFKLKYLINKNMSTSLQFDNFFDKSYQEVAGYETTGKSIFTTFNWSL
ncbi:MAG: TonB-dependent receptor [Oligoflexia bacterium]|nr:TonB-dependent receptor [Oligoflexia bacterium]